MRKPFSHISSACRQFDRSVCRKELATRSIRTVRFVWRVKAARLLVYQLEEYETDRRHATLVAILLDTAATLTDEILNLHDRLTGSFFTKAKHKYEKRFAGDGKAVNDKVRLYAKVGAALIAAKEAGEDPFRAIEVIVPWDAFTASVREAEQLSRDAEFDSMVLLVDHFTQLGRYSPTVLDTFDFRASSARQDLMNAIEALREMNRSDARKVPVDAPTAFVKARWGRFVFKEGGIDRKFYELAAMSELKNVFRSGDVSVIGSRQFKDFDEYLIPRTTFDDQHRENRLGLVVEASAAAYQIRIQDSFIRSYAFMQRPYLPP